MCTERYTLLGSGMCDAKSWGDTCCPLLSFDWLVPKWNAGFAFTRKDSLGSFELSPVLQQEQQTIQPNNTGQQVGSAYDSWW